LGKFLQSAYPFDCSKTAKVRKVLHALLAIIAIQATPTLRAASIAAFDINGGVSSLGPTQVGFVGLPVLNNSLSPSTIAVDSSSGSPVQLQLTSSTGYFLTRNRPALSGVYSDLFRDFVNPGAYGESLSIYLSGLTLGATYDLTFFAYDSAVGSSTLIDRFTDITPGGTGNTGSVTLTGADPSDSLANSSVTLRAVAGSILLPGGGTGVGLIFNEIQVSGGTEDAARLNGVIVASVPETLGNGVIILTLALLLLAARNCSTKELLPRQ
jgi:hypothetical protein